ncbi:Arm DNA-binding domain-containing protein [Cricetibacter osteomyelitidis]|uniref:Arm DNA-binding domain-containing protein n=1 Tax=Cricetibacter osteomyelitidis TaxID=1521931 RepID=UPI003C71CBD7
MLVVDVVDKAKPQDKPYRLADGNRLFLLVKPTGVKTWQFNYKKPFQDTSKDNRTSNYII